MRGLLKGKEVYLETKYGTAGLLLNANDVTYI